MSKKTPKVFIAPLDWGLGHTTRCVSVIREFLAQGWEVVLGTSVEAQQTFFGEEFFEVKQLPLPAYSIKYPKNSNMVWQMLKQWRKIKKTIRDEHQLLEQYIREYELDLVVSDNRYGLYSSKVQTVFITHQIFIQASFFRRRVNKINHRYINQFDVCWVPDVEGNPNLSGDLSHGKHQLKNKIKFVGPLTRFEEVVSLETGKPLAIISGPEPQRTLFYQEVSKELKKNAISATVVLGKPETQIKGNEEGVEIRNHLSTSELSQRINAAPYIISRPGYSTLMDLSVFGKKAMFVPTPGQTEQQYLAKKMEREGLAVIQQQGKIDLKDLDQKISKMKGISQIKSNGSLQKTVEDLTDFFK